MEIVISSSSPICPRIVGVAMRQVNESRGARKLAGMAGKGLVLEISTGMRIFTEGSGEADK
jgi:hypothetical protein